MSFRRDKEKVREWQAFLQEHREELVACGIPPTVLDDKRYWDYFVFYGYYTPVGSAGPIVDVDGMDRPNMERLCLFLEREYPDSYCMALNRLQYLLKRGRHAENPV